MKSVFSRPLVADLSTGNLAPSRRTVLKGLSLFAVLSVLKPTDLFAQGDYAAAWRSLVCKLSNAVCHPSVANYINALVTGAPAFWTSSSSDFHQSFTATIFLDVRIQPYQTTGGRYFEFDRYPFYDSHSPCRRIKDVNEMELRRFLNSRECEDYGGVVSPCSERYPYRAACHEDDFNRTAQAYGTDPQAWEHLYVRNVTDGRKSYYAHAVKPRATTSQRPPKQVFLSPDSV